MDDARTRLARDSWPHLLLKALPLLLVFSLPALPAHGETYVIDAALPNGGDCENPPIDGIWNAATSTCVLPEIPYPGVWIEAQDVLTIESSTFVEINCQVGVTGLVHNRGDVQIMPPSGEFSVTKVGYDAGTLLNDGAIVVASHSLVNHNYTLMVNHGTIDVTATGRFVNTGFSTFTNTGTVTNQVGGIVSIQGGTIFNEGTFVNYDYAGMGGCCAPAFDNRGTFVNHAEFYVRDDTVFTNRETAVNGLGASFENEGLLVNTGTFDNDGTLYSIAALRSSGTIDNDAAATFTNEGVMANDGLLVNEGHTENLDTIGNYGHIDNLGTFANSNRVLNVCASTLSGDPLIGNPPLDGVTIEQMTADGTFQWCEVGGAGYQVVTADLDSWGILQCEDVGVNAYTLADTPDPGNATLLLVRTVDSTWDTACPEQVGSRDDWIGGSGACP